MTISKFVCKGCTQTLECVCCACFSVLQCAYRVAGGSMWLYKRAIIITWEVGTSLECSFGSTKEGWKETEVTQGLVPLLNREPGWVCLWGMASPKTWLSLLTKAAVCTLALYACKQMGGCLCVHTCVWTSLWMLTWFMWISQHRNVGGPVCVRMHGHWMQGICILCAFPPPLACVLSIDLLGSTPRIHGVQGTEMELTPLFLG